MDALAGNLWHGRSHQRSVNVADRARPSLVAGPAHDDGDVEIPIASFQLGNLLPEDELARRAETKNQVDLSRPGCLGEISRGAHHRRYPHAACDQDHTFRFLPSEDKGSVRCLDFDLVATLQLIVQEARDESMVLAFDSDLDAGAPGRARCNGVRT